MLSPQLPDGGGGSGALYHPLVENYDPDDNDEEEPAADTADAGTIDGSSSTTVPRRSSPIKTTSNHKNNTSPTTQTRSLSLDPPQQQQQACLNSSSSHNQRRQRRLAVVLLFACTVLVFADQNLMSPNLTAIADYFGFDNVQRDRKLGGDIALAFFVLGAPAALVIGCLADHYDRTVLLAVTVVGGEGACLATYWVTTYPELYVCRALTGLSMGGALPLIYSILGDLFEAADRHAASSYVGIGMGLGISLGQGVAGFLGPSLGWRVPFLVISIPALLCATAFGCLVPDPERGGMEEAVRNHRSRQQQHEQHLSPNEDDTLPLESTTTAIEMSPLDYDDDRQSRETTLDDMALLRQPRPLDDSHKLSFDWRVHWSAFVSLLSTPTLVLALVQGAPGCVPWGIVNTYLNDYLAVDRGMTVEYATVTLLLFGVGNFAGMLLGGHGGAYLYRHDRRYPAILAGGMAIFGCFPFWILLNRVNASTSLWMTGPVSMLAGLCSGVTGPIIKATLQNVTLPQTRGQAFALFNTFDDFGRGLGPVFVAVLISRLGGRMPAFNVGVLGWMACGVANLCVFFTVERDERKVQTLIAAAYREEEYRQVEVTNPDDDDAADGVSSVTVTKEDHGDSTVPSVLLQPSLTPTVRQRSIS